MPKESSSSSDTQNAMLKLAEQITQWSAELGFAQVGVSDTKLEHTQQPFKEWIDQGFHGDMEWLKDNQPLRFEPQRLHEQTIRVLSFRMDYLPQDTHMIKVLKSEDKAYISRYALGRDYHKLIRKRLSVLAKKIEKWCEDHPISTQPNQRPFVDSAPVLERPLAEKAGLGWTGKHTLILNKHAGSWFFLGELFTNLPLPLTDAPVANSCADCTACLKICPTDAFPEPYKLDARRCISYLTIENKGAIAEEFREPMGNRVFGCDDCQLVCPWNKYAKPTQEKDFSPRHNFEDSDLLELFNWDEQTFLTRTQGSAIRRIGFERWQRNLSVGLGNSQPTQEKILSLKQKLPNASPMLHEHFTWAIRQLENPPKKRKRKLKRG